MDELITAFREAPLPLLVFGGVLLAFGWVLYRAVLTIAGGVLGAAIGLGIASLLVSMLNIGDTAGIIIQVAGGAVGLIAGVFLFRALHKLAFFITGVVLGGWGAANVLFLLQENNSLQIAELTIISIIAGVALLGGLLLMALSKYVIAIASAGAGTLLMMQALDWPHGGLIALPLFIIGLVAQLKLARFISARHDDEDE